MLMFVVPMQPVTLFVVMSFIANSLINYYTENMTNLNVVLNSKFFYLLTSLILYFLASPFLIANRLNNAILSIIITLVIVLCINVINRNRILLFSSIVLGSVSMICHWIIYLNHPGEFIRLTYILSILLFLTIMTFFVIATVASRKEITVDSLLGAICGYFLLGLTWAMVFLLIDYLDPTAILDHRISISTRDHIQQMIYFSYETLATLGYGDILPVSDIARTISWLEAVTGQIYLAVWISQLVGLRIAQVVKARIEKDHGTITQVRIDNN